MNVPDSTSALNGLMPCSLEDFPFVDRYSHFGVVFPDQRGLGPGPLQVRSMRFTPLLCEETLACWLVVDGGYLRIPRRSARWLPWLVEESGSLTLAGGTEVAIIGRHVFAGARTLVSEFVAEIDRGTRALESATEHDIAIAWLGRLAVEGTHEGWFAGGRYGRPVLGPRTSNVNTSDAGAIEGGMACPDPDDPLPEAFVRIVARTTSAPVAAKALDRPGWDPRGGETPHLARIFYQFDRPLDPHEQRVLVRFETSFCATTGTDRIKSFDDPTIEPAVRDLLAAGDMDGLIDAARDSFERRVGWPDLPGTVMPHLPDRLWRARTALVRTGYQGTGSPGQFGELTASTCVPSGSVFTRNFFWDALFTSVALADFEPDFARGAIRAVFCRQTSEGYSPEHTFNYDIEDRDSVGRPQAPIASWAVASYMRLHPNDTIFLKEIYPVLVRNHAYWQERADVDRDGLSEWTWSGQTADNSPLYDEFTERMGWLPPIASVQLNCFLYRDARLLASLAERTGAAADAKRFNERASAVADALRKVCYVESERRYLDYNHATGRHTHAQTFYLFWPLWAGVEQDPKNVRELIDEVLLDPMQFNSSVPFPSTAYDEPTYDPSGYWRGRSWPQITYWLLETLCHHGYREAADEIAKRVLAVYSDQYGYPENLATDPRIHNMGGFPDYNWGIAAYYLLATGSYRDPLPL